MATDRLGLYVHIPYCVRKCNYCDFCSLPNGGAQVPEAYVDRITDEILSYSGRVNTPVDTVYFGGGTPSLLSPTQMARIVYTIRKSLNISPHSEWTLEVNPGTLTKEKVDAFFNLGFNRVSLGLQSIHENEMKILGRIHTFDEFISSYNMLRDAGFGNISVDLMYGIPHQTLASFKKTLDTVISLSPEHISVYGLIVEEGTPFYQWRESLPLPTLDDECDMYELAGRQLAAAGYEHYEISNYARDSYRSRHNSLYWRFGEYIGVGAAAHSFFGGHRYFNTDRVDEYIASSGISVIQTPESECDLEYECAMLGLRLKEGVSLSDYESLFGHSFIDGKEQIISRLEEAGLLTLDGDRLALTERGFYLSNSILVEIL